MASKGLVWGWLGICLASTGYAEERRESERVSGQTPFVVEGVAEAPELAEVPLPAQELSDVGEGEAAARAKARLEAMLSSVEELTGIPEEGFALPMEPGGLPLLPRDGKTGYSEKEKSRVPTGVQR